MTNNLDAGNVRGDRTITLDAGSNSVSAGQAVKFDGSGNITPTTANGDDWIGVVQDISDPGDSMWTVEVLGHIISVEVDANGGVSAGETLIPSGNDNGLFSSTTVGMKSNTDNTNEDLYMNHPVALEDGSANEVIDALAR